MVPWKISQLGRLEHSVQEPMQGLHLLRNFSWSQVSTEQGHSAASVVLKKHHTLGHQMPQTRSMLGQLRCLSAEPDGVRKLRTCRKVLHRLEQGRSAVTGRHMFVSELVSYRTTSIQVPWAKPRVLSLVGWCLAMALVYVLSRVLRSPFSRAGLHSGRVTKSETWRETF